MLLVLLVWLAALLAGGVVVLVREGGPAVGLVAMASVVVPLVAVGILRHRIGVPVEVTWSGVGFSVAAVGFAVVWFALPWDPANGRAADE